MKIEDIVFAQACCTDHDYAEIETAAGWVAIMRDRMTGAYSARRFDKEKRALDIAFVEVAEAELGATLK